MLAAFVIVGGYMNRGTIALRIKSVFVKVPPKAAQTPPPSARHAGAFDANAGWALSALPECFTQIEKVTGPPKYVLARLPAGASMLYPGTALSVADCRVTVTKNTVVVRRGEDRLQVPPIARLYRAPGTLSLLRSSGGGYELRIYKTSS